MDEKGARPALQHYCDCSAAGEEDRAHEIYLDDAGGVPHDPPTRRERLTGAAPWHERPLFRSTWGSARASRA